MNNLLVSFELLEPVQNEAAVLGVLKKAGASVRVRHSFWYVRTALEAAALAEAVRAVLDAYDNVVVIDATNDRAAWVNLDRKVAERVLGLWRRQAG